MYKICVILFFVFRALKELRVALDAKDPPDWLACLAREEYQGRLETKVDVDCLLYTSPSPRD